MKSYGGEYAEQRLIEEEIKQRAWSWIGHTLRRPDGHLLLATKKKNEKVCFSKTDTSRVSCSLMK